ncbi:MAG: LysR family transcriptional regulator [Rhodoferax sp.]|nr:LysR family transcriptional regulator [Pseudorhodobacter sp.]
MDNAPDWSLLRSFLAVAESGSLSGAARVLGLSQPTLGRHITETETALKLTLFTRTARGLALSVAGTALLPHAQAMQEAAQALSLAAAGRDADMSGTVRITASQIMATYILPAMLADLRMREPQIEIELVPSDTSENLLFREADIAVRMYRPTQLDLITQHLIDLPLGLYAAKTYLNRVGRPTTHDEVLVRDLIGFDRSDQMLRMLQALGITRTRNDFPLRCDDQVVYWNLVRAGCGIGGMQCLVGDADPLVERVAPFVALPALPVWLTAAEALRQTPRIRRVFDYLVEAFTDLPHLEPT